MAIQVMMALINYSPRIQAHTFVDSEDRRWLFVTYSWFLFDEQTSMKCLAT